MGARKEKTLTEKQAISSVPPAFLNKLAKQMWKVIVPYLTASASLKNVDSNLIEMYCTQYGIYRTAYDSINKDGIQSPIYKTVQNSMGDKIGTDFVGYKRNPATTIYNDALKQLVSLGAQLGLSPKSRVELNDLAAPADDGDAMKDIKKFFGGKA